MNRVFCAGLLAAAFIAPISQPSASEISQALDASPPAPPSGERKLDPGILEQFGRLPLAFEENRGQASADTRFVARGPGYQVQLSSSAIALGLAGTGKHDANQLPIIRMRFVGARTDADATGIDRLSSTTNYFRGADAAQQLTDVPNYSRVRFDEVYPGIGLVYYGNQRQLEYDLVLQPGADPNAVRLAFDGADRLGVNKNGDLQLTVGSETVQLKRPLVYQEYNGKRHSVAAWFARSGHNEIAIRTANYDHRRALTIDPVLVYSSYLGGSGDDHSISIAVDGAGNTYLTGYTRSSDFPILSAYQTRFASTPSASYTTAFITKVNAAGTTLVYSTYLGDLKQLNFGYAIAVDAAGDAYVTGETQGTAFPITTGAYQTTSPGGANNSFVAKLGPAGNALIYSTYVRNAKARGIALDTYGNAYITGTTSGAFATTSGAYQTTSSGASAFVLKLNPGGTAAVYSTFFGGTHEVDGNAIAVDASGNAYVGGYAAGGSSTFPVTKAFQSLPAQGYGHGFIAKINPQASGLVYSVLLAGEDYDEVFGVAVDSSGSAYATGETTSFKFPASSNAFQKTKGGVGQSCFVLGGSRSYTQWPNGFVTKLAPDGSALTFSSFLGGNPAPNVNDCAGDWGKAVSLDSAGHAFVAGNIQSTIGFPLTGDLKLGQPIDSLGFFVAKISSFGDTVLYGTHIGWPVDYSPYAFAIAVDTKGDVYATSNAGTSVASSAFLTTTGAYKTTPAAGTEAIFLKLTTGPQPVLTLATSATSIDIGQTVNATVSAGFDSGGGMPTGSVIVYDGLTQLTSVPLSNGTATATLTLPVGIHKLAAVYRNNGAEGVSPAVYVAVNPLAACN